MPTAKQNDAFKAFVMEVIENFAGAVYAQSQSEVPVVTGELKNSGSLRIIPNGYEIRYSAPYASLIDGMGEEATLIFRDAKTFRFPKAPTNASGFVSRNVENLAEDSMDNFIYATNSGNASAQYDFYIQ